MAGEVEFQNTILGGIVKDAEVNWDYSDRTQEEKVAAAQAKVVAIGELGTVEERVAEAKKTVGISVDDSIKGIAEVAELTENEIKQLTEDINTRGTISGELVQKIQKAFEEKGIDKSIVDVLAVVHDGWVRDVNINPETNEIESYNNGKKFENPDRMTRLYQFSPLQLLDFKEAKLDLLFLKPILENMGIQVNETTLEQSFLQVQEAFLAIHGIKNVADLKAKLQEGAAFYPALEGIRGANGELITDRLAAEDGPIAQMTEQVAKRARVPEKSALVKMDEVAELAESRTASVLKETTGDIRDTQSPTIDENAIEEQGE